ncbi:unnamed protein product, partial [marine sediment metagenome]
VGNVIYPLTEGQPLPIKGGDTIRLFYAFKYKMPETTGVKIWASLYNYTLGILNRQEKAQTKQTITLEKALEWKDYPGEIDIVIGEISSGTYGLICELPDHDLEERIDNCLEVAAVPSVFEMIGPLLVLGLMAGIVSMMAPTMKEGM